MFFAWQETMTSEGYSSPAQCLKYTKAGLGIRGENIINDVSDYFAVLKHLTEKTETTVNNSKMLTITLRLLKTKMQGIVDKTYGIITKISETYNNVSVEKFMNNDFN